MKIPFLMIFSFFGIISAWAAKALEDGKISAQEAFDLIIALADVLGVTPQFDVSEFLALSSQNAEADVIKQPVNSEVKDRSGDTLD